jgi:hypothetical protein
VQGASSGSGIGFVGDTFLIRCRLRLWHRRRTSLLGEHGSRGGL